MLCCIFFFILCCMVILWRVKIWNLFVVIKVNVILFSGWNCLRLICGDIVNCMVVVGCCYFLIVFCVMVIFVLFLGCLGKWSVIILFVILVWFWGVDICVKFVFLDDFELIRNCVEIIIWLFGSKFLCIFIWVLFCWLIFILIDLNLFLFWCNIMWFWFWVWINVEIGIVIIGNVLVCVWIDIFIYILGFKIVWGLLILVCNESVWEVGFNFG